MYSSLQKVDVVVSPQNEEGKTLYVQTDHRSGEEIAAELDLSVLFAIVRILWPARYAASQGLDVEVRYSVLGSDPPEALLRAIVACGGTVEVQTRPVAFAADGADAFALADDAFAGLGMAVASREGLPIGKELVLLLERRVFDGPTREDDEIGYWTLQMELAAVAGEALRAVEEGGSWGPDDNDLSDMPFVFGRPTGNLTNVFGRVARVYSQGVGHGPSVLLGLVSAPKGPSHIMLNLKGHAFGRDGKVLARPLLDLGSAENRAAADMPFVVFGEDRPETFSYFRHDHERASEIADLETEALACLANIEVEVGEIALTGTRTLMVSNHYFAAEKLLDVAFMKRMHQRLGAKLMMVAIPRKGLMFLTDAVSPDVWKLVKVARFEFDKEGGGGEPLTATPFLVDDGRVVGIAATTEHAPEPPKKKGFFSWLPWL